MNMEIKPDWKQTLRHWTLGFFCAVSLAQGSYIVAPPIILYFLYRDFIDHEGKVK